MSRLAVQHLTKRFATPQGPLTAIEDVSLAVEEGEFLSIIGPSGCGKSTLFNIVGGLIPAEEGQVLIDGVAIAGGHRDIGMVFQEESTFPWLTCIQNVAFPLEVAGVPKAERLARAAELLRLVGLEGFGDRFPAELSGGMKQRTAIARTLAMRPKILLMDEPFASLDEQTRMLLGDKILQICRELRQTTLLITHNITEAVQLSDRVAVMSFRPGRIKRLVEIDLPRPRSSDIVSTDRFGHLVGEIWRDLRSEALRGMAENESMPA
jgi:NitT/TauT family transport system ATP-binding protein